MKIVVTGATSMIGVAIIENAIKEDNIIYAVVRPNSKNIYRLPTNKNIRIIECEINSYSSLFEKINDKCDIFYHIAWDATGENRNNQIFKQVDNISYTLDAVESAKKLCCIKFIGAGSQAEYGPLNNDFWHPNDSVNPVQNYGIAKYCAGKLATNACNINGLVCYWVRIFSVYGEYDKKTTLISKLIAAIKSGDEFKLTKCVQKWDYLYSSDAGEAFYLLGKNGPLNNKIYCLGSGYSNELKYYVEMIKNLINPDYFINYGAIEYSENSIMNLCADISDIKIDAIWEPKTSFKDGIKKVLECQIINKNVQN